MITITHTAAEGTLATGDTRPHVTTLKAQGWRWGRSIGCWFIPQSRDRLPNQMEIDRTAGALRAAGAEVIVDVIVERASTAEREANRADRIAGRQNALAAKADRKTAESNAAYDRSHQLAQLIPFGQPILVGHHSERGHRADLKRIHRAMDKSCEAASEAKTAERRAAASERNAAHRLTGPATMRRIERIETERRDIGRKITQATNAGNAAWLDRLQPIADGLDDDLIYWQEHLGALQLDGLKIWGPADFAKGDLALTQFGAQRVVRVNKKSLSVATPYSWTETVTYDRVRGKIDAEQTA